MNLISGVEEMLTKTRIPTARTVILKRESLFTCFNRVRGMSTLSSHRQFMATPSHQNWRRGCLLWAGQPVPKLPCNGKFKGRIVDWANHITELAEGRILDSTWLRALNVARGNPSNHSNMFYLIGIYVM